jgi:hypothetical protein
MINCIKGSRMTMVYQLNDEHFGIGQSEARRGEARLVLIIFYIKWFQFMDY